MKKKIIPALLVMLICLFSSILFAAKIEKKYQFAGQWPNHLPRAMTLDTERNLIFLGDGGTLSFLTPDLQLVALVTATTHGQIGGVFYDGNTETLYVACRTGGLTVFDVSKIDHPLSEGSWTPSGIYEILTLRVDNGLAYVCCGVDGLVIADLSDLANPKILSQTSLPGGFGLSYAMDIHIFENYAYVADLYNGIHVVDTSNPEKPDYIKGIVLAGTSNLYSEGDYLYTTLQGAGAGILNISNPGNPALEAIYKADDIESTIAVDGNYAWIGYNSAGLRAVDISGKTSPIHDERWIYSGSGCSSLALFPGSNTIYMADYDKGLISIDMTDKTRMTATVAFDTPADAIAIDISGDYVFAVDNTIGDAPEKEGLRILKLTTSYSTSDQFELIEFLELKGFCPTPGTARDVMVVREYAYVADGVHGLQVISLSDFTQPVIIGTCDTQGTAAGLFVKDDYVFVANGDSGLCVVNIRDKSLPVVEGTKFLEGNVQHVVVSDNFAYAAAGSAGLQILDIANPSSPALIATAGTPEEASGVFVVNTLCYVAVGADGICIFDITNPAEPTLLATADTAGDAKKVMVSGNFAYVADGKNGMQVFDVSVPTAPIHVPGWSYDSQGAAMDIFSGFSNEDEELYAFIADGAAGVIGINLSVDEITDEVDNGGSSSSGGCFIGGLAEY